MQRLCKRRVHPASTTITAAAAATVGLLLLLLVHERMGLAIHLVRAHRTHGGGERVASSVGGEIGVVDVEGGEGVVLHWVDALVGAEGRLVWWLLLLLLLLVLLLVVGVVGWLLVLDLRVRECRPPGGLGGLPLHPLSVIRGVVAAALQAVESVLRPRRLGGSNSSSRVGREVRPHVASGMGVARVHLRRALGAPGEQPAASSSSSSRRFQGCGGRPGARVGFGAVGVVRLDEAC